MNTNVSVSSSSPRSQVTVSNVPQVITVSKAGSGATNLSNLNDVNTTTATDGAVLQYDSATGTWIAENILDKSGLQINCGNF